MRCFKYLLGLQMYPSVEGKTIHLQLPFCSQAFDAAQMGSFVSADKAMLFT